jgi:hypothetical protein
MSAPPLRPHLSAFGGSSASSTAGKDLERSLVEFYFFKLHHGGEYDIQICIKEIQYVAVNESLPMEVHNFGEMTIAAKSLARRLESKQKEGQRKVIS